MRFLTSLFLALLLLLPVALLAQGEKRRTLEDYFKMLPEGVLEGEPARMWAWAKTMPGTVMDVANGYMRSEGGWGAGGFRGGALPLCG